MIPRGTGWDFVRTFDIPRDLDAAIDVALHGAVREIDLGARDVPDVGRRGGALATSRTSPARASRARSRSARTSPRRRSAARSRTTGRRSPSSSAGRRARCASRSTARSRSGKMIDAIVCNGRYLGGGMMMCPEAEPDDGALRRPPHRRRDEARPPVRAPEDVQGEAPPASAPRAPARQRRDRSSRRAAADRARRRAAGDDAGALRDRPASACGCGFRLAS